MSFTDVVIVGGGIGGAALALALARAGHSAAILEREASPPPARRPEILWPPTMSAFERLGVVEAVRATAALPLQGLEVRRATEGREVRLLRVDRTDMEAALVQPWSTDPTATRIALLDGATATGGVELLRGVEVREVLRGPDSVTVQGARGEERVERHGRVVIGDDGVRSQVRERAGIGLPTELLPVEFLGTAGPRPAFLPADEGRAWLNPPGLAHGVVGTIFFPLPGDRFAMVALVSMDAFDRLVAAGHAAFWGEVARVAPPARELEASLRFPEGFGRFRRPFGHADRYIDDRLAILGDAAHPVTPAGGQGANMAVADAMVLADLLAKALKADDLSSAALFPYERARRAANERSITFSRRVRQALGLAQRFPPMLELLPPLLRRADRSPRQKQEFLRTLSSAFVGELLEA